MLSRTSRTVDSLVLATLVACVLGATTLGAFRARTIKGILLADASQPAVQVRAPGPEVVRFRYASVDVSALLATRSDEVNASTRPTFRALMGPPSLWHTWTASCRAALSCRMPSTRSGISAMACTKWLRLI